MECTEIPWQVIYILIIHDDVLAKGSTTNEISLYTTTLELIRTAAPNTQLVTWQCMSQKNQHVVHNFILDVEPQLTMRLSNGMACRRAIKFNNIFVYYSLRSLTTHPLSYFGRVSVEEYFHGNRKAKLLLLLFSASHSPDPPPTTYIHTIHPVGGAEHLLIGTHP